MNCVERTIPAKRPNGKVARDSHLPATGGLISVPNFLSLCGLPFKMLAISGWVEFELLVPNGIELSFLEMGYLLMK